MPCVNFSFATNRGLWNVFMAATNLFFGATLQGDFSVFYGLDV